MLSRCHINYNAPQDYAVKKLCHHTLRLCESIKCVRALNAPNSHKQFAVFLFKFENVNNESSLALAEGLKLTGDIAN